MHHVARVKNHREGPVRNVYGGLNMVEGYSKKSLLAKLGLKENFSALVLNEPKQYRTILGELPRGVVFATERHGPFDFIHLFTNRQSELVSQLPLLKQALSPDGMIWISWPKKSSGVQTDVSERTVREIGLDCGLVDVKVCAIDGQWSGLKFVYRLKDRP